MTTATTAKAYDLIGIGLGPFNLSLAALLQKTALKSLFLEKSEKMAWHPGMLLPGARMQTSFLKDLVTPVDPTSPYSFLAYLVKKKRLYRFLSADFKTPSRHEFNDYLSWVAQALPNIHWQEEGLKLDFDGDIFYLETSKSRYQTRHLAIGTGLCQNIPPWAKPFLNPKNCFHSAQFTPLARSCAGKTVAVVGGGQSGAEIVLRLLQEQGQMPANIAWLTERSNFLPLDASPFVNEYFTPAYVHHFYHLPEARKKQILKEQELAGSGISPETLLALAQCLYEREFHDGCLPTVKLLPYRRIFDMEAVGNGFRLDFRNLDHESNESMLCNMVILATGYRYKMPAFLKPIAPLFERNTEGLPILQESFAAKWQGSKHNQIYFLNAGLYSHGIAEPQLSLMAWRSAAIVNHLLGQDFYDIDDGEPLLSWEASLHQQDLAKSPNLLYRNINALS